MTGSDFDWMISNRAVRGWKAPVKASVSCVSLLQLSPFFASIFPLNSPETRDTQASKSLAFDDKRCCMHVQLNLSTTATLRIEESGRCRER